MVKFLKNCLVVLVVLVFLATSSINKANLSCEGLFDGEEESINISLLLYSWWHPTSFLRGDFLDGRWGTASVHMYGKLNEKKSTILGTEYKYRLLDRGYGTLEFHHREDATYGTLAWLDERQRLDGRFEGLRVDMKCAAAVLL